LGIVLAVAVIKWLFILAIVAALLLGDSLLLPPRRLTTIRVHRRVAGYQEALTRRKLPRVP
jgi:hypothetical protein